MKQVLSNLAMVETVAIDAGCLATMATGVVRLETRNAPERRQKDDPSQEG